MAALHRNNISLGAKRSTHAAHGISEPGNSEATDDTSYGDLLDSSPAHTQRNNASAVRIQLRLPLDGETKKVSTPSSIALWLILRK